MLGEWAVFLYMVIKEAVDMSATLERFFKEIVEEKGWDKEKVEQERMMLAKTMISDGESNEKIIRYTKLTMLDIERLRADI